jgi:hypothetical protein
LQQSTHVAFHPNSFIVGPLERHYNLSADRSIAWEFKKYKHTTISE